MTEHFNHRIQSNLLDDGKNHLSQKARACEIMPNDKKME